MRRGGWIEPNKNWNDTSVTYCQVCGRLIPRRSWVFEGGKGAVRACSPDCEDLYEEYLKPTYGAIGKNADHQG
jgi:hypothetical protein